MSVNLKPKSKLTTSLLFIAFLNLSCANEINNDQGKNGTSIEGEHFSYVLYDGISQNGLSPVESRLEENYSKILGDLEIISIKKVIVKIWNNETNFLDTMQRDLGIKYQGATGYVYGQDEIRILNRGNASQTALHEFCHAVSLAVNNRFGNNPRWFWEAVAIYEAGEFKDPRTVSYLADGNFPTISELNSNYNSGYNKIYDVGFILSEYIIHDYGKTPFINLIKSNANIEVTLGITTLQFETGWKTFVKSKYF